jgi:putative oxidoreductase
VKSIYATLDKLNPYVLSLLRVVAALLLLEHGLQKFFGFPVPGPAQLSALLILAAILETIGAAMLLVGFYTRLVAFLLSGEMAFVYFLAHAPRSFYPIANSGEIAVLFCFVFFYFVFAGGGAWSVDRAVLRQG